MEDAAGRQRKRQRDGDRAPSTEAAAAVTGPSAEAQYLYLPIADALKAPGVRVCLFAAVSDIGAAVRSRGTDFTLTLRIVDQSRASGISVTFFADNTALLPCVRSSGDVISLHNIMIAAHNTELFVKYNKKISSFALFEGKVSTECRPYQYSVNYHGSKHDNEILTQMRTWLAYHPQDHEDIELQLRSIKSDSAFDLICKVLHVHEASNGVWILYVWDGTDTPATEFQMILDTKSAASLPLHLEETPLPREVLCSLPCVGSVLRVFTNSFFKELLHLQKGTYWARFCNITCKQEFGMWKGIMLPICRVRLLSNEDGSVVERLKMFDSRIASKVHRRPMASLPNGSDITDVEYKTAGYSTLMKSLTHGEVVHKFKTLVRVVAVYPCEASDLSDLLAGKHAVRLTLEDPTARIHAYIHRDDGASFFGGFLTVEAATRKMNKLLGIPEPTDMDVGEQASAPKRNPPWIWCCIKSYYLNEDDIWGSRRYRIYATEIRD
ncbi:hypothetical protein GUJ93_ZPchr0014g47047 [Zizania palustris]|uniref:Telomeric single stranded DNA binding POT1/Cdc13 domain-containing protein n=1 Tax=Zizania palustris TaxID=103762 RepID=A0A8J5T7Y3_ZIZPA|nr:hypothetical protein GUJ93_ZPchr0014g47047 [Zizania palustris]